MFINTLYLTLPGISRRIFIQGISADRIFPYQ